jgi:hypothetical protein
MLISDMADNTSVADDECAAECNSGVPTFLDQYTV